MRRLAIFAAIVAAFAFASQSADAHSHHINKKLKVVAIGVGAASTATYFAINDWKWNGWSNSSGLTRLGAWGATTLGCAAVSPIVGTIVLQRALTMREAHVLVGSCVVPIVGGLLVNAVWEAHPEWEPAAPGAKKMRHKKKMK
jgi:hypothetical protein